MTACPRGGEHQYRKTFEGDGWIEHTCRKCGDVIRRRQAPARRVLATAALVAAGLVLAVLSAAAALFYAGVSVGAVTTVVALFYAGAIPAR